MALKATAVGKSALSTDVPSLLSMAEKHFVRIRNNPANQPRSHFEKLPNSQPNQSPDVKMLVTECESNDCQFLLDLGLDDVSLEEHLSNTDLPPELYMALGLTDRANDGGILGGNTVNSLSYSGLIQDKSSETMVCDSTTALGTPAQDANTGMDLVPVRNYKSFATSEHLENGSNVMDLGSKIEQPQLCPDVTGQETDVSSTAYTASGEYTVLPPSGEKWSYGPKTVSSTQGRRAHVLPPCKVCGDQATGFHYGVNTCEACKGFFRRCLVATKLPQTCSKGGCKQQEVKRKMCRVCRYKRCLQAGMSVEGIKTGRYTYRKRTQDIVELKKIRCEKNFAEQAKLLHVIETKAMETVNIIMLAQLQHLDYSIKHMESMVQRPKQQERNLTTWQGSPPKETIEGLFWRGVEKGLIQLVKFAKALSPFRRLSIKDQMTLLKWSAIETWMVSRHNSFFVDHQAYSSPHGPLIHLDAFMEKDHLDVIFDTAKLLKKLNLTVEETVVLKVLVLLSPDRCQLEDPGVVERGQAEVLQGLQYLLKRNHPEEKHLFAKVISSLCGLRTYSHTICSDISRLLQGFNSQETPLLHEVLEPPDPQN